ncbi:MAG: c-type cytochrome, partial [Geminicoccales bacterium]
MSRNLGLALVLLLAIGTVGVLGWPLISGAAGGKTLGDPRDAEQVALGERVYRDHCADCHGANLEGQPNWKQRLPDGAMPAPPHDETGHTWHHPDQQLFDYTKLGGAAVVPAPFKSAMPGFGEALSDDQIWAVRA